MGHSNTQTLNAQLLHARARLLTTKSRDLTQNDLGTLLRCGVIEE